MAELDPRERAFPIDNRKYILKNGKKSIVSAMEGRFNHIDPGLSVAPLCSSWSCDCVIAASKALVPRIGEPSIVRKWEFEQT